jgi:hypothetical protein
MAIVPYATRCCYLHGTSIRYDLDGKVVKEESYLDGAIEKITRYNSAVGLKTRWVYKWRRFYQLDWMRDLSFRYKWFGYATGGVLLVTGAALGTLYLVFFTNNYKYRDGKFRYQGTPSKPFFPGSDSDISWHVVSGFLAVVFVEVLLGIFLLYIAFSLIVGLV